MKIPTFFPRLTPLEQSEIYYLLSPSFSCFWWCLRWQAGRQARRMSLMEEDHLPSSSSSSRHRSSSSSSSRHHHHLLPAPAPHKQNVKVSHLTLDLLLRVVGYLSSHDSQSFALTCGSFLLVYETSLHWRPSSSSSSSSSHPVGMGYINRPRFLRPGEKGGQHVVSSSSSSSTY